MDTTPPAPFVEAFRTLEDPRRPGRTLAHNLHEILTIALCAAIGGANDWVAVETFGRAKIGWFRRFLPLVHGIPSHDTFGRVFAHLKPAAFQACFGQWIADVCGKLGRAHIAIDGKRLAGSEDAGAGVTALHLVSAWATDARLSLGQVAVDDKSNEITAIPKLLELIEISGALVSIDAMGCQKEIATTIRAEGGDYLLAVKDNQPHLRADLEALFDHALEQEFASGTWDGFAQEKTTRGREELRQCWVLTDVDEIRKGVRDYALWKDLTSVIVVVSERGEKGKSQTETRFYISSRVASARQFAGWARNHWGIENGLHWVLDVVFREDTSRVRNGDEDAQAENVGWLRRMVLSVLKQIKTKSSLNGMRLKAGWDEAYMEEILLKIKGF
ncbi:ISAs1 family transposase [Fimbriiglobus ruber]|uniref:Mobile element protein n=1 Tax=Fimbriiglobus ruber TaxID=1908690 RepID=A0A225E5K5_9BACT|nr:ISAs1 family transposase [Fimbriiglobus ruber]OWK45386.1 Mobile element protein [Fimbriiglobus ruber]